MPKQSLNLTETFALFKLCNYNPPTNLREGVHKRVSVHKGWVSVVPGPLGVTIPGPSSLWGRVITQGVSTQGVNNHGVTTQGMSTLGEYPGGEYPGRVSTWVGTWGEYPGVGTTSDT